MVKVNGRPRVCDMEVEDLHQCRPMERTQAMGVMPSRAQSVSDGLRRGRLRPGYGNPSLTLRARIAPAHRAGYLPHFTSKRAFGEWTDSGEMRWSTTQPSAGPLSSQS